ncbi:MAG TPA: hypothetical protein VFA45_25935 [Actinomycetes bacterium]|nr:hypothetical protein [Actinomycetes bacterium]
MNFTARTLVSPWASYTTVPTARRSTSSPMGTMPVGVLTSALYGWHAEHWGWGSTPTLNQTGELKAARWLTRR